MRAPCECLAPGGEGDARGSKKGYISDNTCKTIELCRPKAKTGFCNLKTGGYLAYTSWDIILLALVGGAVDGPVFRVIHKILDAVRLTLLSKTDSSCIAKCQCQNSAMPGVPRQNFVGPTGFATLLRFGGACAVLFCFICNQACSLDTPPSPALVRCVPQQILLCL